MKETLQDLKTRRSIRSYRTEQISEEELKQVLEAGTYAPTGMNMQSPVMVVIQDKALIEKLSRMNADVMGTDTDPFYGAPTVIVVLAHTSRPTYREDGSLVMGNLLNAAHAIGLGSCWIHRAKEVFKTREGQELLEEWGLNDQYEGIGHCLLGYIDGEYPETKPRKEGYILWIK
ncbi:nitroreductase [Lacrimispora sp. NSJ-141]|uniref:Nitroreductase n=1 Tax=Lientehia hominis TaxID=2897778 RepID=A0AAP2RKG8_9FIRM|nr:nitroreductase [Lientehia hominis]MCD2493068.1 nitroreductase [Lientehia hominis]